MTEAIPDWHVKRLEPVVLRRERIEKMLGFARVDADVERIVEGLGLGVTSTEQGWKVDVPSWRCDIAIEADLLEELARVMVTQAPEPALPRMAEVLIQEHRFLKP